jgi:hypothetical protein
VKLTEVVADNLFLQLPAEKILMGFNQPSKKQPNSSRNHESDMSEIPPLRPEFRALERGILWSHYWPDQNQFFYLFELYY